MTAANDRPLVRWSVGDCSPLGWKCLTLSVCGAMKLFPAAEFVLLYNGSGVVPRTAVVGGRVRIIDQRAEFPGGAGVSWKLHPPRLDASRTELFLDSDLVLEKSPPAVSELMAGGSRPIMLEDVSRHYGRFEKDVPDGLCLNSGLFGLPASCDPLTPAVARNGGRWEKNAGPGRSQSVTADEQGLVAATLVALGNLSVVPEREVRHCEKTLKPGLGFHFVGLNGLERHAPFLAYRTR